MAQKKVYDNEFKIQAVKLVLMLSLAVMIPLCHADMKLPG